MVVTAVEAVVDALEDHVLDVVLLRRLSRVMIDTSSPLLCTLKQILDCNHMWDNNTH